MNLQTDYLQYGQGNDILRFIINNGMVNISDVQNCMEAMNRKELLQKHPYKIWEGKDGKWRTYLSEENSERRMIKRNSLEAVESAVIEHIREQINNPTIEDVFNEWNDRRTELGKISKPTQERNRQVFRRHYSEFGQKRIKSVTESDISDFLEKQISCHSLSAKSILKLKRYYKGLIKAGKKKKSNKYKH